VQKLTMAGPKSGTGRVVAVSSLGAFVAFLDVTIVNVAFPSIRSSFRGAELADLSWVLNSYNVVFAALLVPGGRVADLLGRRQLFVIGLWLFILSSALCAAAPSVGALIASRSLQAAGAAIVVSTSLALLLAGSEVERRATAVGIFGAVAAVSAAVGPSLGGVLIELGDWRLVFLVNLPLGVLTAWLARRVPESRDPERGTVPDVAGVVGIALAMAALALAVVKGNDWGWTDSRTLSGLGAAALLGAWFAARSRRHPRPVVEPELFRLPGLAAANAGPLVFAAAFYAMLLCNVLYLTEVWGYSALTAGLALTPGPLTSALVAGPAGRVADRMGQRVLVVPGALVYTAGILLFVSRVGPEPAWASEWLPATIVTGAGIGLTFPALASAAVAALPATRFGIGSAVNAAARQIGAVLGIAVLVAVLGTPRVSEAPSAFDDAWGVIALTGLSSLVAGLLLRPRLVLAADST
jgi:EmrB/QacA subfamily drug resistance transporter